MASAYVSASVLEAFPLTPFEAMAAGVPCILSDIDTHREVARPAAEYFVSGCTASLHEAVTRALAKRTILVQAGLGRAAQYRWADNAKGYISVFEQVLGEES